MRSVLGNTGLGVTLEKPRRILVMVENTGTILDHDEESCSLHWIEPHWTLFLSEFRLKSFGCWIVERPIGVFMIVSGFPVSPTSKRTNHFTNDSESRILMKIHDFGRFTVRTKSVTDHRREGGIGVAPLFLEKNSTEYCNERRQSQSNGSWSWSWYRHQHELPGMCSCEKWAVRTKLHISRKSDSPEWSPEMTFCVNEARMVIPRK